MTFKNYGIFPGVVNDNYLIKHYINIKNDIYDLFVMSRFNHFEDCMESRFAQSVNALVREYEVLALDVIEKIIFENTMYGVSAEAVIWMSLMDHPPTHDIRVLFLGKMITHPACEVRDKASIGLVNIEDKKGVGFLNKAILKEESYSLKKDMEDLLKELNKIFNERKKMKLTEFSKCVEKYIYSEIDRLVELEKYRVPIEECTIEYSENLNKFVVSCDNRIAVTIEHDFLQKVIEVNEK